MNNETKAIAIEEVTLRSEAGDGRMGGKGVEGMGFVM